MKKYTSILLLLCIAILTTSGCNSRRERQELERLQFLDAHSYAIFFSFDALVNGEVMSMESAFHANENMPLRERYIRIVFVHSLEEALSYEGCSNRVMFAWPWELSYRGVAELNAIVEHYDENHVWRSDYIPDLNMFPIVLDDIVERWEEVFVVLNELDGHRWVAIHTASRGENWWGRITVCEDYSEND